MTAGSIVLRVSRQRRTNKIRITDRPPRLFYLLSSLFVFEFHRQFSTTTTTGVPPSGGVLVEAAVEPEKTPFEKDFATGVGSECLRQLYNAVFEDDVQKFKSTLSNYPTEECNVNEIVPDGSGQSLLMFAVLRGKSVELITELLDNGADVTIGEQMGYTPIHGVGFQGRYHLVETLVNHPKAKMDVNDKHDDGHTPLIRACWGKEERHAKTARELIKHGANPDEPFCMKRRNPGTKEEEVECKHLLEIAKYPPTRDVLMEYTKLEKYKKKVEKEDEEAETSGGEL